MEIKDNVISLFEHRLNKQRINEDLLDQQRFELSRVQNALFERQHSDDDCFINRDEFEFSNIDKDK